MDLAFDDIYGYHGLNRGRAISETPQMILLLKKCISREFTLA